MGKKSIIYDGACTLCIRSKNSLLNLGLAEKDYTWAYQEMPDEYLPAVDYERFRNEMALIDLEGEETLYGPDALVHLLSSKLSFFKWLFSIGLFYRIFAGLYKIVAFNRTAIMVPRLKKVRCASCEPDTPAEYRWRWVSIAMGLGILIAWSLGVLKSENLFHPRFYLGILSLLLLFYYLIRRSKENYLEIAAHAAGLFVWAMSLMSLSFFLMDTLFENLPINIWILFFALPGFFIYRDFKLRSDFLQLNIEERVLGGLILGLIFLLFYLSLIF